MGFKLNIKNAPFGSFHWMAAYSEGWNSSGWLDVYLTGRGEEWNCPYMAIGQTDLFISVVDSDYKTTHFQANLGPVYDDRVYEYDCDTRILADITSPVVYEGKISRKELEYDEARANIPAYDIPQDQRGLVHIWGRNDMATTQRMGIWWQVTDPDGIALSEHAEWEAWPYTPAGDDHEFIGGRFDLNKEGTYTIAIQLFMNPADQVVVDDYYGNLCTVALAVPEPEFSGFGITEYSKR